MMPTQRGNALWMILLAIALLGGLTAMFARSSSTSDDTGDYERNSIAASEIMRYTKSLEIGIQNLITRGCSESDISFWNDSNGDGTENGSDDYYNAGSPGDRSCHVFRPEGAGLTPMTPKAEWLDRTQSAQTGYGTYRIVHSRMAGVTGSTDQIGGSNLAELTLTLPYLTRSMCLSLNAHVGIAAVAGDAPADGFLSNRPLFTGVYTGSFTEANWATAQYAGCLKNSGSGLNEYTFFGTILPR